MESCGGARVDRDPECCAAGLCCCESAARVSMFWMKAGFIRSSVLAHFDVLTARQQSWSHDLELIESCVESGDADSWQ